MTSNSTRRCITAVTLMITLAAITLLGACDDTTSPLVTRGITLQPMTAVGRSLVLVSANERDAILLDADDLDAPPRHVRLPHGPQPLVTRPGAADEALVLCRGASDDPRNDDEAAALVVLDQDGLKRRYPLSTRFNAMHVAADGRYAMLFFNSNAASGSLIFNPNEIAIVDLDAQPSADNPRSRTLRSFGSAPSQIVFSPPMQVAGSARRLAVVLFDTVLLLIDLENLDRPEYTVELATGGGRAINLAQVVFDTELGRLYLRGDASSDVYVVTLVATSSTTRQNDFVPSLNQLGIGAVPRDMALYNTDDGNPRLLAVTSSPLAVVVDANSSRATPLTLPFAVAQIQMFEGTSPFDPVVAQRAALYAPGGRSLMFLDLRDVESRQGRNLETLQLQASYSRVTPLDDNLVLLIHTGTGLSVLDLADRTASPIQSNQQLGSALPDTNAGKLWLSPPGQTQVAFLDLNNFHPGAVDLTRPIETLVPVAGDGPRKLAVQHRSAVGHVTVLDATTPTDLSKAAAVRGFLLDGLFDRADEANEVSR